MSKEKQLAKKILPIIDFMENNFKEEDGINKIVLLKSVAAYYDNLVAAETMRTMIIKSWGSIK